jgi:hypothetical protein
LLFIYLFLTAVGLTSVGSSTVHIYTKTINRIQRTKHTCCCFPMPPHVRHGLHGLPPGCGRSVTDFWVWDAREVRLRCPDEVDGDTWIWSTSRGLNLNCTNYPDDGHDGDPPLSGKNPHGRAWNLTRDLMISSQKRWPLDHEAGRRNIHNNICLIQVQLDVHYILYFFLDNVSSTCFGCYLHPSPGTQLQHTAIGFVRFGVLFLWSRYWFGTPLHLNEVSYRQSVTDPKNVELTLSRKI